MNFERRSVLVALLGLGLLAGHLGFAAAQNANQQGDASAENQPPPSAPETEADRTDQVQPPPADRLDPERQPDEAARDADRRDSAPREADRRREQRERQMDVGLQFDEQAEGDLTVSRVAQESLAARAGLQAGDVILSVDGQRFQSQARFHDYLHSHVGQRVAILVDRDGAQRTVHLTPQYGAAVGRFDEQRSGSRPASAIGVQMSASSWGPVVSGVYAESPAHRAGLQQGDTIIRIDGQRICWADQFVKAIQRVPQGEPAQIVYLRDGSYLETQIVPGPSDEVFAGRLLSGFEAEQFAETPGGRFGTPDRAGSPPPAPSEERIARGQRDPQRVMRPDIERMAEIDKLQQQIDRLRRQVDTLRSELDKLQQSRQSEPSQPPASDETLDSPPTPSTPNEVEEPRTEDTGPDLEGNPPENR